MANVLTAERQMTILNLLVEGTSIRSISRLTGAHLQTILNLLVRFGTDCREFLDERMQGLQLDHLELDEQWTYVAKKQARLTVDERAERWDVGDIFLWTAVDKETKLVPTFALGKRSADNARRFLMDIRRRLAPLGTLEYPTVQISTDGFPAYGEAVDLAFSTYARFGTITKQYRNASMRYDPGEIISTNRRGVRGITSGQRRTICTSHVERHNLTNRILMKRFNRLTLCFSKKLENLAAAVAMYMAYYNYCWDHATLGTTPAHAAGLTDHQWSFEELFNVINAQHVGLEQAS